MSTMPLARMAATFVVNSSNAPRAWRGRQTPGSGRLRPAAAPARSRWPPRASLSEISDRASATEPTAPVARAATKSTSRGVTRAATWLLVAATTGKGANRPSSQLSATTAAPPMMSSSRHRRRLLHRQYDASTIPRIGGISGATIIAPITVAAESLTTPADAITAASTSSRQYRQQTVPAQTAAAFGASAHGGLHLRRG